MTDSPPLDTSIERVEDVLAGATDASARLGELDPGERGELLVAVADALEVAAADLLPVAARETHLPDRRLEGELARTTHQLRLFAEVLAEGSYLEATIDTADPRSVPTPRPDLRRVLVPVGPVLVFAASNFPFAFSVAGGDTASALAAGCPVVLKAHPGHPGLSALTGEVVTEALTAAGGPEGTFAVVTGVDKGRIALLDSRIRAVAFTGSLSAGRALFDLAMSRETPIPFYGELGSLNPVFVTPGAAERRAAEIADGYVNSFTLGVGQFCTKPGLLFLPAGSSVLDRLAELVRAVPYGEMLNDRIRRAYTRTLSDLAAVQGVRTVVDAADGEEGPVVGPTLLAADVPALLADPDAMLTECFGPTSIVVEYEDTDQLVAAADAFAGSLTATVHGEPDEGGLVDELLATMRDRAGRIIWNGWPTGVAVAWAMHHGGPYPATTAPLHTSVGATAIRRFLRPVSYQGVPQQLLPKALQDRNHLHIMRRVNGSLTTADVPAGT
jgi:NADP-dependent aldehyde dehydrogenase